MRSDLLQDAIGMVRDEYIEDAHADSAVERAKRYEEKPAEGSVPRWMSTGIAQSRRTMFSLGKMAAGLCAVTLLVLGLYRIGLVPFTGNGGGLFESAGEMENTTQAGGDLAGVGDMTETETDAQWETGDISVPVLPPELIWPGTQPANGELAAGAEELEWTDVMPDGAVVRRATTPEFLKVLEAAKDEDVFAFVVCYRQNFAADGETDSHVTALKGIYENAKEETRTVRAQQIQKMKDAGMSSAEAWARIYTDPLFAKCREKALEAKTAWEIADLLARFERQKTVLDEFAALGFTLLCDAETEAYQVYLAACNGLGVMYGTKKQILELNEMGWGEKYRIFGAMENAQDYRMGDEYTSQEIFLSDGSKLTDRLIAAYEENGGQSLKVEVQIAIYNSVTLIKDDLHRATLEYMGLTQAEYDQRCNTHEFMDQYLAAKRRISYHMDYNEEVVNNLLLEGELIEPWDSHSDFLANLTYERALELAANKEIAYIELAD